MEKKRVLLFYPPGALFQRGEDRCQQNIDDGSAQAMRACNDLGYAAAILMRGGYDVKLQDYQTQRDTFDVLLKDMDEFKPDMIMMSITNTTIFDDLKVVNELKKNYNPIVVLKGALFFDPEQAMLDMLDLSNVDYLIGGEIDFCIGKIADLCFEGVGTASEINNILYKDENGKMVPTRFHVWDDDLDSQPFPARELMKNELYIRPDTKEAMATIQTARGCPSQCVFCLTPEISGKRVRFRSPQNVLEEMIECYEKHHIRNFFFKADTFTINPAWVKEMCELIINSKLYGKIQFTANSRVRPLSKETLELMKKAGCFLVAFGFESGSDEMLKTMRKGTTVAENKQAAKWCKEIGLPFWGYFVIGFPWETREDILMTKKLVMETDPDFIEVTIALPFYGTPMYQTCKENNLLEKSVLGSDFFHSSTKGTMHLSIDEVMKLRRNILLGFYLRPKYIFRKMEECVKQPSIFVQYVKYGLKLVINLFKK
jgi:radical SAM superfamily enzyme YgiQ (UPF0313 family)